MVSPTQRIVKSWLRASSPVAGHVPHHMLRNDRCARVRAGFARMRLMTDGDPVPHVTTRGCCARSPTRRAVRILRRARAPSGPMRAADVGAGLGIPANQASFHLRQLAKYGLVVAGAGGGARQARPGLEGGRTSRGFRLDLSGDGRSSPAGQAAVDGLPAEQAAWAHRLVEEVFSFKRPEGRTPPRSSTRTMKLTKDEAAEFMGEIDEVLETWRDKTRGRSRDRQYLLSSELHGPALTSAEDDEGRA